MRSRTVHRTARIGKGILSGLGEIAGALSDGGKLARIREIDEAVYNLQQERDHLIAGMNEPGKLKVSENYDPHWRKPVAVVVDAEYTVPPSADGRLTHCKGRANAGVYHDAHPGCPYVNRIHNAHDFTLRD